MTITTMEKNFNGLFLEAGGKKELPFTGRLWYTDAAAYRPPVLRSACHRRNERLFSCLSIKNHWEKE